MKRRVLAVYWRDAAQHGPWASEAELQEFIDDRQDCLTIGIEVRRDKHALHLAATFGGDEVGGIWKIPNKMIQKVVVIGRLTT